MFFKWRETFAFMTNKQHSNWQWIDDCVGAVWYLVTLNILSSLSALSTLTPNESSLNTDQMTSTILATITWNKHMKRLYTFWAPNVNINGFIGASKGTSWRWKMSVVSIILSPFWWNKVSLASSCESARHSLKRMGIQIGYVGTSRVLKYTNSSESVDYIQHTKISIWLAFAH